MAMKERKFTRVKIDKKGVYEVNTLEGRAEVLNADILDVSPAGACIRTKRELGSGVVVRLKLELKDAAIPIPCIAEVVWSRPDNKLYRAGLQFLI